MEQFWNRKRALNLSAAASGSSEWRGERAWRKVLPTAMIIDTTKNGRWDSILSSCRRRLLIIVICFLSIKIVFLQTTRIFFHTISDLGRSLISLIRFVRF